VRLLNILRFNGGSVCDGLYLYGDVAGSAMFEGQLLFIGSSTLLLALPSIYTIFRVSFGCGLRLATP
jgi:hypothetical protein